MKRLGLKLICLLAALVLWLQVAATTVLDETVTMPLQAVGLREGTIPAAGDLPRLVRVRVRGSKLQLVAHRYFGRRIGSVVIDLAHPAPGSIVERDVGTEDVRSGLVALSIVPPVRLRVRVVGVAVPAGGREARR
ncbi:MAG: hypothetical protein ACYDIE_07215 [Candidatus Krumholzibacteriia bacterium]